MICGGRNAHLSQIFPDDLAGMWRVVHTHGKFLSVIVAAVMKFLTHSIYLGFARMLGFESLVDGVDSSVEMESWEVFGRTASGHAHTSAKEMASVRVAVGISVARYPSQRSPRAVLPHKALILDEWRQSERWAKDGEHAAAGAIGPQVAVVAPSSDDASDRDGSKRVATAASPESGIHRGYRDCPVSRGS
jgi:hypothetical protein